MVKPGFLSRDAPGGELAANQTSGSAGQKSSSLRLTAATAGTEAVGAAAVAAGGSGAGGSSVDISRVLVLVIVTNDVCHE